MTRVAKVLQDRFGTGRGFMTTAHAYTPARALLDGSIPDIAFDLGRAVSREDADAAFAEAASALPLQGTLAYGEQPLVSTDIIRSPCSCSSCRLVDVVERLG